MMNRLVAIPDSFCIFRVSLRISFYENIEDFNLIDKMNLYFKGDYYFDCEFSEEEQYWVDRACNNSSFEEYNRK